MRKLFSLLVTCCAIITTSCSDYREDTANSGTHTPHIIMPTATAEGATHAVRGYATTASNALSAIHNFQTWAYDATTDGLYMGGSATEGRTVTNTSETSSPVWSYTPQQFWPVHALNFVAVTPATPNGAANFSTASSAGIVTLSNDITIPTDVQSQQDIMYAEADRATQGADGSVPLTFKHALSQIVFKGKFNDAGAVTKVTIAEISLCNISKSATLTFNSRGQWFNEQNNELYPTVTTPAYDTFTLLSEDLQGSVFDAATVGTTAFDLTVSGNDTKKNAWLMLPQHTAKATGTYKAGDVAPLSGAYIKIRAKLEKDGVIILGNEETDAFYIPFDAYWDRNRKYTYTIEFNGTSALTPITFSVAVEDWTETQAYYAWNDITATVNPVQDMSTFLTTPGNFSGITAIDDTHYAIVDDKATNEGWYPVTLAFNSDGTIASLTQGSFITAASGMTSQDNEDIAYCPVRNSFFLTREMDAQIHEYTTTGVPTRSNITANSYTGIVSNAGFEALTYNSNTRKFFTTTEQPTTADAAGMVTVTQYDGSRLVKDAQWQYRLEEAAYTPADGDTYAKGVSALCSLEDGRLLVLEREAWISRTTLSATTTTKVFVVNPTNATPGSSLTKTLLTTWGTADTMFSVMTKGYFDFANYEGICLGPRLADGSRLLILLTDSQNRYSVASYTLKDFWRTVKLQGI